MGCDFEKIYEHLLESLQEIEKKRNYLREKMIRQTLITVLILLAVIIVFVLIKDAMYLLTENILAALFVFTIIVIVVGALYCSSKVRELTKLYKDNVVNKMVEIILPGAKFESNNGVSQSDFSNSLLFTESIDKYSSEDYVSGMLGKTEFQFSEIHAEERHIITTKDGTQETWEDVFKGFFFIADFHKDFKGFTIIERNSFLKFSPRKKMDRVKLEDPIFEKIFDVFGTDQLEARYLLTPSIMERLVALNAKLSTRIILSFQNSKVNIAIPQKKNHFEASLLSTMLNKKKIDREFGLLIALVQIVEDLNLNTRIWSKE